MKCYCVVLLTLWPWPWPLNPKTVPLLVYPKVIPYTTKFENFGIICFWVMLRTNKQTNRRTRKSYSRQPTESVWVINNEVEPTIWLWICVCLKRFFCTAVILHLKHKQLGSSVYRTQHLHITGHRQPRSITVDSCSCCVTSQHVWLSGFLCCWTNGLECYFTPGATSVSACCWKLHCSWTECIQRLCLSLAFRTESKHCTGKATELTEILKEDRMPQSWSVNQNATWK